MHKNFTCEIKLPIEMKNISLESLYRLYALRTFGEIIFPV